MGVSSANKNSKKNKYKAVSGLVNPNWYIEDLFSVYSYIHWLKNN